jgi:DNA-binding winged helix-turn-helix (wHTH) protein
MKRRVQAWHRVKRGFRFGRWTLDVCSGELGKDGVWLRLQHQPFELLLTLLRQPGEVVMRQHLERQLWPDGTFVDFEHGLNAAVKRLRDAIGDSATNPRFVETLPRRGYRFIAQVAQIEGDETDASDDFQRALAARVALPSPQMDAVDGRAQRDPSP